MKSTFSRRLLIGAALSVGIVGGTVAISFPLLAQVSRFQTIGVLERVDATDIKGWACTRGTRNYSTKVHIYADGPAGKGTYIQEVLAAMPRNDVKNICGDGSI